MKKIILCALFGSLILGGLSFVVVLWSILSEGTVFHGPVPWFIAGIYGAGGAGVGFVVGGIIGSLIPRREGRGPRNE